MIDGPFYGVIFKCFLYLKQLHVYQFNGKLFVFKSYGGVATLTILNLFLVIHLCSISRSPQR